MRARRFPGLINCTAIDFFHPWPREALVSVASRFLADVELGDEECKANLAVHMAEEHLSVTQASKDYYQQQRRYNYVTPKSYLELIGFYKFLLDQKRSEVQRQIDRSATNNTHYELYLRYVELTMLNHRRLGVC